MPDTGHQMPNTGCQMPNTKYQIPDTKHRMPDTGNQQYSAMIKLTVERHNININELVESAVKLHGHAGPYLNLGIKMGLLALELLGAKGYFDLSTEVEVKNRTPFSCLIDGLQISTGCTLGKGNIKVKDEPGDNIRALFKTDHQALLVSLKPEVIRLLDFQKESCEALGQQILEMSDKQLFTYEMKYEAELTL